VHYLFISAQSSTRFYSAGSGTAAEAAVVVPYGGSRPNVPDWQSAGGGVGKMYTTERALGVTLTAPLVQSGYNVMRHTSSTTSTPAPLGVVQDRICVIAVTLLIRVLTVFF
jgi:hypothetical protein